MIAFGKNVKVTTTETKIAVAENIPNRIVGLKLENKNTKKPTIIVAPVIIMALPVVRKVSFSKLLY